MSAALSLTDVFPKGFALTGGIPVKSQDLAASIVFIIAYFVLTPLAIWRVLNPASRTLLLIRPVIFLQARIVTFILRAVQANGHYSTGLFIAEQILLLCGFLLICEPLVALVKYHTFQGWVPTGQRGQAPFEWLLRFMRLALLVAIILGIVTGSEVSSAETDPSDANTLRQCRWANTIIALVVIVLAMALVLFVHVKKTIPLRSTAYLLVVGALLFKPDLISSPQIIPSAYKLAIYAAPPSPVSAGSKAVFYCLFSLPEFVVTLLYLGVNLEVEFDVREGARKEKWDKDARKGGAVGLYVSEKEVQGVGMGEIGQGDEEGAKL
ncbi:hypothetical protein JCM1840_006244 [Sporobolomyces johnsonii]